MSSEQKGILLDALFDFGADGVTYEGTDPLVLMAFNVMAAGITRAAERYQKRVDANRRNIRKRYDGIPSNTTEYHGGQTVNETVTEGERENVNVDEVIVVVRPTLEEIREYCETTKTTISPERFFNYYQSRGWQLKPGIPLADWKAALNTWQDNERKGAMENGLGARQGNDVAGNESDDSGVRVDTSLYGKFTF